MEFFRDRSAFKSVFIRLRNELCSTKDKKLEAIGTALEKYSDAFELAPNKSLLGKIAAFFWKKNKGTLINGLKKGWDAQDVFQQKNYVADLLGKQRRRILVIIDDIDRLSNEQICQVFQLITAVANFPNVIYLMAFDKEIVVRALAKVQEGEGEDYLQKIIQMPIQIPDIQKDKLRKVLLDYLNKLISEYEDTGLQQSHWQVIYPDCVEPFIKNIRDIKRLCNSIQFKLAAISSEVDFTDIVAISALEISFPRVYEWVKENKAVLVGKDDWTMSGRDAKTQEDWHKFYLSRIQSLIQSEDINITERIVVFLAKLFPSFGIKIGKCYEEYDLEVSRKNNYIAHPDKFDRYFHLDLDMIGLKKSDINEAIYTFDCGKMMNYLLELDEKNESYAFLEEMKALMTDIPADRAETIIKALFGVSPRLITHSGFFALQTGHVAQYRVLDLLDLIEPAERMRFFCDLINTGDTQTLQTAAQVINMLELAYGRLAANGKERNYKKVFSLEELKELEKDFIRRTKELLVDNNLFDFDDWRMVCHLLESFDSDYAREYLSKALQDDENIAKYMYGSVASWTGGTVEYEVQEEYKKYLSEERIILAITSLKESGKLFSLSKEIQRRCAAFFLSVTGNWSGSRTIAQSEVDELLAGWRKKVDMEKEVRQRTSPIRPRR